MCVCVCMRGYIRGGQGCKGYHALEWRGLITPHKDVSGRILLETIWGSLDGGVGSMIVSHQGKLTVMCTFVESMFGNLFSLSSWLV